MTYTKIVFFAFLGFLTLSSCSKDELTEGVDITLRNTLDIDLD